MSLADGTIYVPNDIRFEGEPVLPTTGDWIDTDHYLRWRLTGGAKNPPTTVGRRSRQMLYEFSRLKTPEQVLRFARTYGVLGAKKARGERATIMQPVPRHLPHHGVFIPGLPEYRSGRIFQEKGFRHLGHWSLGGIAFREAAERFGDPSADGEPLAIWFLLSRQFRAVLVASAALKGRSHNPAPTLAPSIEFGLLGSWEAGQPVGDIREAAGFIRDYMNAWLVAAHVSLGMVYEIDQDGQFRWQLRLHSRLGRYDLFAHLVHELYTSIVGDGQWYVCSACCNPYVRAYGTADGKKRKAPRRDQENFCEQCTDIARRRATERYRARKLAARKDKDNA